MDDVAVTVPQRQLVGLVGPNGAGKSTLFGVLSGLIRPSHGTVVLDGDDVTNASPRIQAAAAWPAPSSTRRSSVA